jgi:hypothetical protein
MMQLKNLIFELLRLFLKGLRKIGAVCIPRSKFDRRTFSLTNHLADMKLNALFPDRQLPDGQLPDWLVL